MDYIFRWIQMRFLSGTQLDLFAGMKQAESVPVAGHVTAPANTVSLNAAAPAYLEPNPFEVPEYADRTAPQQGIAPALARLLPSPLTLLPPQSKIAAPTTPPPPCAP